MKRKLDFSNISNNITSFHNNTNNEEQERYKNNQKQDYNVANLIPKIPGFTFSPNAQLESNTFYQQMLIYKHRLELENEKTRQLQDGMNSLSLKTPTYKYTEELTTPKTWQEGFDNAPGKHFKR